MTEDELKEMIKEANRNERGEGVVTLDEFLNILSNQSERTH